MLEPLLSHLAVKRPGRGRPRTSARAGLAFDYPTPDATLAMFEMLVAIGFE